ncbi:UDP-3-O-acyl-N-acetylglucosamine deacetylase [Frigidibacter sp.]|uniref:UDP-3-O-acyl-N-acetylglucosamine deacetylase n=1 Tax=Frigidibacter sp. TaxID=2586418 RepID=UPI00273419D7|nr:UDP-3-O-acyl-N-acetylglucosamine deacetylase [Frigidibacter sp.]MDP3341091.1 UDP-3-O-acyl-N-acetylglucosamine deacetylase [Frigidibacter sp.]
MQTTIRSAVTFQGVGLHSGAPVRMTIHPASANYGIWFRRTDIDRLDPLIPARWDAVVASRLCTLIANRAGTTVSTIEHIMAALAGTGIHNALIEIDGPEVPILDGSAAPFVSAIMARGLRELDVPVRALRILAPVEVRDGEAVARLEPGGDALDMRFDIDFTDRAIGRQTKQLTLANGAFVRELSDSRTFCRRADVETMQANGLALGGTFDNAVVVDGDRVLSPGGLRHADEPVRHKMLDALGDLALAGGPILGSYVGHRAGHALTNRLLRELFRRPDAFCMVELGREAESFLPGAGLSMDDLPAFA